MAMTHAKTGRSMKNLDMTTPPYSDSAANATCSWTFAAAVGCTFMPLRSRPMPSVTTRSPFATPSSTSQALPTVRKRAELAKLDGVVGLQHPGHGHTATVADHGLLRDQLGVVANAFEQPRVDEHPGQQLAVGIRKLRAQHHGAGALVDFDFGELQRSLERIRRPVFELESDFGALLARTRKAAVVERLLQPQHFGDGLANVDVDRIELLHGRELPRLTRRGERAFRAQRAADAAADRREHFV